MGIQGKRVLVTGVCSAIGEAIARNLVTNGASVVGLSQSKSELKRVTSEIGDGFEPITADIRTSDVILQLARLGRFDALVCHADLGPNVQVGSSILPDLMQQQLFCALHTIEGCGPAMRDAGHGHVLIIENVPNSAVEGVAKSSYQTWKGGYDALIRKWSSELDTAGVKVTVIGLDELDKIQNDQNLKRTLSERVADAVLATICERSDAVSAPSTHALVEIPSSSETIAAA
ncbi:MAG: SDR family NAD(P)-dependent oxidoreductase [Fimbriimonadales bacterium]